MSRTVTMNQAAKAKAKEEQLIAEMMGNAEGEQTSENTEIFDPNQPNPTDANVPTEVEVVEDVKQDVTEPGIPESTLENTSPTQDAAYYKDKWLEEKGRTTSQKVKYDANIYKVRQENQLLKQEIVTLKSEVGKLSEAQSKTKSSNLEGVFSQDVVDVLGVETADAIQNVVKSLQEQVVDLKGQLTKRDVVTKRRELQRANSDTYSSFVNALKNFVPDCEVINVDPKFLTWLDQPGPTGVQRIKLLQAAQYNGDVERVADFFKTYKASMQPVKPKETPVKDSVRDRTAPVSQGSGEQDVQSKSNVPEITVTFIDKFGQDVAKGKYKGRESEKQAIQSAIDDAYLNNTLIFK